MGKNYTLILGDSLRALSGLEDKSIQCCITSPPYFGLRDYGEDEQIGLEETPEEYVEKLVNVFREVKRVLKDDGTLWLNIGDSYAGGAGRWGGMNNISDVQSANVGSLGQIGKAKKWQHDTIKQKDMIGIPWMLAFALRSDGWYLRQDIIWNKPNPMPESVKDRCTKSHEYIFLLSKKSQYKFNYEEIQEDAVSENGTLPGVVRNRLFNYDSKTNNNPNAYLLDSSEPHSSDYKYLEQDFIDGGRLTKRNKRDVWNVTVSSFKEAHFATFPEELVLPCVLAGSDENDVILDPFNGSGTTGAVALKNYRKYIGIDINKEYLNITTKRLDDVELEMSKERLW